MKRIKGNLILEGVNYFFYSEVLGKIKNPIGYVKYISNVETNIDVGFIDYYPINEFLMDKIYTENTTCYVETDGNNIKLHEDKLILLV